MVCCSLIWFGSVRFGLVWLRLGFVWHDFSFGLVRVVSYLVWFGVVVWFALIWFGGVSFLIWFGLVLFGLAWRGVVVCFSQISD